MLSDISFTIEEGEFWGILGKNGAGKTSLIELLVGFRCPDLGQLIIIGHDSKDKNREYLKDLSFLSHDISLAGHQKVKDFFKFHSFFYENYSVEIQNDLAIYFDVDIESEIQTLSTGQQKKIQIIAALAANTKLIIIDEITAVLDPLTREKLYLKLKEHVNLMKKTVLVATNLSDDIESYADKALFINNKKASVIKITEAREMFNL